MPGAAPRAADRRRGGDRRRLTSGRPARARSLRPTNRAPGAALPPATIRRWSTPPGRSSRSGPAAGAVLAGWIARRIGLPAVVGYLALGIVVSPFTPGYVADHEQLQLLADLGVVLLLFEVGIEVDLLRIRSEQRGLILAAPIQVVVTTLASALVLAVLGLAPLPAALIGLSVALSSSVVIVNITRSRRRTTDRPTEDALLGWSAIQDSTGVVIAAVLLALLGIGGRPLGQAAIGLVAFLVLAVGVARLLPIALKALHGEHDLFLITSVASGLALAGLGSQLFGVRSPWRRSSAASRSRRARRPRRRAGACCPSGTCSRSCSSSRSGP